MDSGGTTKVTMSPSESWVCCDGDICSITETLSIPIVGTQDGGVGSTVSDGVWVGHAVKVPADPCRGRGSLESYRFTWTTTAEDFHGNRTSGSFQAIQYP
jgi:hypothetical protein